MSQARFNDPCACGWQSFLETNPIKPGKIARLHFSSKKVEQWPSAGCIGENNIALNIHGQGPGLLSSSWPIQHLKWLESMWSTRSTHSILTQYNEPFAFRRCPLAPTCFCKPPKSLTRSHSTPFPYTSRLMPSNFRGS